MCLDNSQPTSTGNTRATTTARINLSVDAPMHPFCVSERRCFQRQSAISQCCIEIAIWTTVHSLTSLDAGPDPLKEPLGCIVITHTYVLVKHDPMIHELVHCHANGSLTAHLQCLRCQNFVTEEPHAVREQLLFRIHLDKILEHA